MLFEAYEGQDGDTFDEGWRNKLVWGDNLLVAASLLERFSGRFKLIYIDPPFATGADFTFRAQIGENGLDAVKEHSLLEEKAYRDTWGQGLASYLQMMRDRLAVIRELLAEDGSLFVHMGPAIGNYIKVLVDEIFGEPNFRSQIIVKRPISKNLQRQFDSIQALPEAHDVVLWYSKSADARFPPLLVDYQSPKPEGYWHHFWSNADRPTMRYGLLGVTPTSGQWKWEKERARRAIKNYEEYTKVAKKETLVQYWSRTGKTLEFIRRNEKTKKVENWFPPSSDRLGDTLWLDVQAYENEKDYATQKHTELLGRIIATFSAEGDLVGDFFSGSGTTLVVAESLKRRWVGCDISRWAIHITRKRLLELESCKPFEVLNLGRYERQYWQASTFAGRASHELLLFEYLAFILKLYSAIPVAGFSLIHGKKGAAMVHVGAVDAPVTIHEINAAIDECSKLNHSELHVLGWEWEMGLYDLMTKEAIKRGVKLVLLQIPREVMERQAVEQGDVKFFELAYLEVGIAKPKRLMAAATLKDFVIPNTELIPDEVRSKVKKWSDYIDYWAVDWEFQNDTFVQGFVAYRTRADRSLELATDSHSYSKPGKYRIVVKVVDIFGNDTSEAYDVEVS